MVRSGWFRRRVVGQAKTGPGMNKLGIDKLWKFVTDHGLLLSFLGLFVVFLFGQVVAGQMAYSHSLVEHGLGAVGYWQYVRTGNFLEGIFANWQAALLQLGALIVFAVFLRTRGAAHSLRTEKSNRQRRAEERRKDKSRPKRARSWIYRNSLSLAFLVLFLVCFVLHLLSATAAYNEQRSLTRRAPVAVGAYFLSSRFWFETMQTWEAEFMAIGLYVGLSIFLRQEGSPESKPVESRNDTTGETNK